MSLNVTTEAWEVEEIPDLTYVIVLVTLTSCFIFIAGLVGNTLVLVVIFRNKEMSTATNLFLANLCVADLLVLLICMPSALLELHTKEIWLMGEIMCRVVPYLENLVSHVSVVTILAITFERYYAICCPFKRIYACSKTRAGKIIAAIWLLGAIITCPFILMSNVEKTTHKLEPGMVEICTTEINNSWWKQAYVIGTFVLLIALPLVILVVLYACIGRRLVEDDGNLTSEYETNKRFMAARKQVVYMLIAIIAFSFVCLIPIRVFILWHVFSPEGAVYKLGFELYLNLVSLSRIMMFINSAGNPILYNIVSSKFREACKRTLCCGKAEVRRYSMSYFGGSSLGFRRGTYLSDGINIGVTGHDRSPRNGSLLTVNNGRNNKPRSSWDYIFHNNNSASDRVTVKRSSL